MQEKSEKKEFVYTMRNPAFWRKLFRAVIDAVALFIMNHPHEDEWERRKKY